MAMSINEVLEKCEKYVIKRNYKSYDLFDALTNSFIDRITKNKQLLRRIAIQVVSKSPMDLHWLGMKKMLHTKTISDLLWFYSVEKGAVAANEINYFFELLIQNKSNKGYGWGLNFPYATRFIDADAQMPNLYNTANSAISICHSFYYLNDKNKIIAKGALGGVVEFMEKELGYVDENEKGWYIYYPGQKYPTYNVNALAIYLLVFIKKLNAGNPDFLDKRIRALINLLHGEQEANGSWYYSRSSKGKWVDGFHTGFVLESLAFAYKEGYQNELTEMLQKGWTFYLNEMFADDGYPKYFLQSNKYPIEAQNYAQTIQTLANVCTWLNWDQKELLNKVIKIAVDNLFDERGFFYYKKTKYLTYKKPYLRWAVTPMMLALSYAKQYIGEQIKA